MPPLQIGLLDLIPVSQGMSIPEALRATITTAQVAERSGIDRVWLAEHHNSASLASSATALMIGQVAAATNTIHVGSGGIMLPNHSPLHVAEEFGTLEALFPGRIELGLGRAPGTDPATASELRRGNSDVASFEHDLAALRYYLGDGSEVHNPSADNQRRDNLLDPAQYSRPVRAYPGRGSTIPFYMLGSSEDGATVAARAGLPFVFASHFAPFRMRQALEIYRTNFVPQPAGGSEGAASAGEKPTVWIGVNVMVAETEEKARHLFTTHEQSFYGIVTGQRGLFKPPSDKREGNLMAWAQVDAALQIKAVGTPNQVREQIGEIAEKFGAEGIIVSMYAYELEDRLRAVELLGEAMTG